MALALYIYSLSIFLPTLELYIWLLMVERSLFLRVLEKNGLSLSDQLPRNVGITSTVGEAFMALTVIYVKQVLLAFAYACLCHISFRLSMKM